MEGGWGAAWIVGGSLPVQFGTQWGMAGEVLPRGCMGQGQCRPQEGTWFQAFTTLRGIQVWVQHTNLASPDGGKHVQDQ